LLSSIHVGSEIIEINGKTFSQFINEWSSLVSYENIPFRNYQITKPTKIGIWNDFKSFKIPANSYSQTVVPHAKETAFKQEN
jgi:hypothetical protein